MRLAGRMSRLGTETAFEVLARAQALERQGKHIVHLELGEPDFSSPDSAIKAGVDSLVSGLTKYTTSPGLLDLPARSPRSRAPTQSAIFSGSGRGYARG